MPSGSDFENDSSTFTRLVHVGAPRCLASRPMRRRAAHILDLFMHTTSIITVVAGLVSCAAYRAVAPGDPKLAGDPAEHRVRVAGYTASDGSDHRFDGYVIETADSLVFVRSSSRTGLTGTGWPQRVSLPRDQVRSVRVLHGVSPTRSVLFGLSLIGVLVLGFVVAGGDFIGGTVLNP